MSTWNAAFLTVPKEVDSPSQGDDEIRNTRTAIQERIKNEHTTYDADATAGVAALDWLHKAGSAVGYYLVTGSAPAVGLSGSPLTAGQLWYDTTLDVLKVWTGAAWTVVANDILGTAGRASLVALIAAQVTLSAIAAGGVLSTIISIGNWNMVSTASVNVAHGLTLAKIRTIQAMIRNDADSLYYPLTPFGHTSSTPDAQVLSCDATNVSLYRSASGTYATADFDASPYNRGWVVIGHIA